MFDFKHNKQITHLDQVKDCVLFVLAISGLMASVRCVLGFQNSMFGLSIWTHVHMAQKESRVMVAFNPLRITQRIFNLQIIPTMLEFESVQ